MPTKLRPPSRGATGGPPESVPRRNRWRRQPPGRPAARTCTRSPRVPRGPVPRGGTRGRRARTRGCATSPASRRGLSPTHPRSEASRASRILRVRAAGAEPVPGSAEGPLPWNRPTMGGTLLQTVPTRFVTEREARSVADSVPGDAEDRLGLGEVRGVDQSSNPLPAFRLAQIYTERRAVADDVASNRPGGIPEERIGLRMDLVRDVDHGVVDVPEPHQLVDVLVQELLTLGEHTPTDVLGSEVRRQGVDHYEPDREVLRQLLGLLDEEHLVVTVERAGDMDSFQDRIRIEIERFGHLTDALRPEGLFGIDPDRVPVHTAVVLGTGHVDRELVAEL